MSEHAVFLEFGYMYVSMCYVCRVWHAHGGSNHSGPYTPTYSEINTQKGVYTAMRLHLSIQLAMMTGMWPQRRVFKAL